MHTSDRHHVTTTPCVRECHSSGFETVMGFRNCGLQTPTNAAQGETNEIGACRFFVQPNHAGKYENDMSGAGFGLGFGFGFGLG